MLSSHVNKLLTTRDNLPLNSVPNVTIRNKSCRYLNFSFYQSASDILYGAAAAIIRIQDTYALDVYEMCFGKLISSLHNTSYAVDTRHVAHLYFEDVLELFKVSYKLGNYDTAIKYLRALVMLHSKNQCIFKDTAKTCQNFNFSIIKDRLISLHNIIVCNEGEPFVGDGWRVFPYRIDKGSSLSLFSKLKLSFILCCW